MQKKSKQAMTSKLGVKSNSGVAKKSKAVAGKANTLADKAIVAAQGAATAAQGAAATVATTAQGAATAVKDATVAAVQSVHKVCLPVLQCISLLWQQSCLSSQQYILFMMSHSIVIQ